MQGLTAATVNGEQTTLACGRPERRRAVAGGPRILNAQAPSTSLQDSDLDRALLAGYARSRLVGSLAMTALVLLAAYLASTWLPAASIVIWTVVALCAHALLGVLCLSFRAPTPNLIETRLWKGLFVFAESLGGLSWVGLLMLLSPEQGTDPAVFQFCTMLVVVAAGSTLAANLPSAATAATAPVALAMVALFALRHEPLFIALASLSIAIEIFFLSLSLSQRLRNAAHGLLKRDAEQARLAADLASARAGSEQSLRMADEANLARSRFLATMNHELRTPLNAILGFSEVMKNEVLGPMQNATYREYASDIHASGGHLLSLINEILDLSGLEAGRYELNEEPVDLAQIVADCEAFVASRARNRGLRLVVEIEPDLPKLRADPRGLRQVVLNLLSNAIKFTPTGGEILVRAGWTAGGGQYVSIRDNGPGIPATEMSIVLSPFGQGESTIRMAEPGAGMGLPIVEAITRLHGGTFELRSKLAEGTEAVACFPRSRVSEPEAPAPARAKENVLLWRSAS